MTFIPFTKYDSIRSILLRSLEQGTGEPVNCINRSMEVSLRKRLPSCPFRVSSDRCCLLLCCLCTVCLVFFLSNAREYYVSLNMTLAVRLPPLFFSVFIRIPYSS